MTIEESRFEIASSSKAILPDLTGHTLVLPCVSIGSVPQLAVDALLEPKNASKVFSSSSSQGASRTPICSLDHRFCIPFLGGNLRSSSDTSKEAEGGKGRQQQLQESLQVFSFEEEKVTIVQQRSPILKSRKAEFVTLLMDWIRSKRFSQVIILTSLDAGLRVDSEMIQPFWYLSTQEDIAPSSSSSLSHNLKQAKLPLLVDRRTSQAPKPSSPIPPMPSGGLAKAYLEAALDSSSPPFHALVTFAAEGDNRLDALTMATLLCQLLHLTPNSPPTSLTQPDDWSLLFGSQANDSMFN